jgi:D-xylose transport system ATP-binding protein
MVDQVRAKGIGVIMITHVMAQAFAVADRIVVMRHGIIAGDVAADETSPDEVVRMITGDIGRKGKGRATHPETGGAPWSTTGVRS